MIYFVNKTIKGINSLQSETKVYDKEIDKDDIHFTNAQFEIFADTLHEAFIGPGTDQDTVVRILKKMESSSDFYKLVKIFGIKKPSWYAWDYGSINDGDLIEWLTWELGDNKPERAIISKHLSNLGIEF